MEEVKSVIPQTVDKHLMYLWDTTSQLQTVITQKTIIWTD